MTYGYDFLEADEGKARYRREQKRRDDERPRAVTPSSPTPIDGPRYREQLIARGLLRPHDRDLPERFTVFQLPPDRVVLRLDDASRAIAERHVAEGEHGRREL